MDLLWSNERIGLAGTATERMAHMDDNGRANYIEF